MTIPSGTPAQEPVADLTTHDRVYSLDVLRGIALLGILLVSIWQFGGFSNNEQLRLRTAHGGGNYQLLRIVSGLFEGKMRSLFSIVFGAGIILFLSRKKHPSGLPAVDLYMRRNMWLIAFGIFNAVVLLWPGDILFHYGILAILLFPFWRMSARGLFITALITTLIFCGKNFWNYRDDKAAYRKYLPVVEIEKKFSKDSATRYRLDSLWAPGKKDSLGKTLVKDSLNSGKDTLVKKLLNDSLAKITKNDTLTKEQKKDKTKWEGILKSTKYDSTADAENNKSMRSSYAKLWTTLLPTSQSWEAMWLYRTGIWDIGSMMLLGMGLFMIGFFSHHFPVRKYWIIGLPAIAIGLLLAWLRQEDQHERLLDYTKYISTHRLPHNLFFPFEKGLLAVGYACMIMLLLRNNFFKRALRPLMYTGRMAFTNYFLQTILCTFFFYGYGMGYFGRLSQVKLYGFVIELWLIQVALSMLWFNYFTIGPLEWVWRRLTYGKWLPIKKQPASVSTNETTN